MATRIRWTETAIVDAINDWVARYGEIPARIDWDRHMSRRRGHTAKLDRLHAHPRPVPGPTPVLARFGSWEAAVAAAGHTPRHPTYRPDPVGRATTAALYASGVSVAQIAARLELDPKTVRERLDRAGVTRRPPRPDSPAQLTEPRQQAILAELADGASTPELARRYGLPRHSIEVIRKRHRLGGGRVMRRVRSALPDHDVELTARQREVVELVVGQHLSNTEAARHLGLAPSTVDMHLRAVAARLPKRPSPADP